MKRDLDVVYDWEAFRQPPSTWGWRTLFAAYRLNRAGLTRGLALSLLSSGLRW